MAGLKGLNPPVRMSATGSGQGDEMALGSRWGTKGFIDESASAEEFKQPIRVVDSGSVCASRQILSKFIERVTTIPHDLGPEDPKIGKALGIEERTAKNARREVDAKSRRHQSDRTIRACRDALSGVGKAE